MSEQWRESLRFSIFICYTHVILLQIEIWESLLYFSVEVIPFYIFNYHLSAVIPPGLSMTSPPPKKKMQFLWGQRHWLVVHYYMSNGLTGRHDERQQEDTYVIKRPSFFGRDKIMKNKISDPFTWYFYFLGLVLSLWHTVTHLSLKTTQESRY